MLTLAPSILSADFARLGEDINKTEAAGAKWLHVDVMDGDFVPSISLGMPVIRSIRKVSDMFFDVHLMVRNPERYVDEFIDSGADSLTVHVEACEPLAETLEKIRGRGVKAGVSINPGTPVKSLLPVLDKADLFLIMTVNPGFGGQKYIDSCTEKIWELDSLLKERGLDAHIEVDGGIKTDNVRTVLDAGADVIVAGSSVFLGDIVGNVKAFQAVFDAYEQGK